VHATIAGVVLGLLAPTRPFRRPDLVDADKLAEVSTVETANETVVLARDSVSIVERLEYLLHPWTSYVIVPVFALANAGVVLNRDAMEAAVSSPVTHGIVVGLVVGKLVGISTFAWLSTRLRIARLPDGTRFHQLVAVAALGGIGFTVSLFVTDLAFGSAGRLASEATIGILVASLLAAAFGGGLLVASHGQPAGLDKIGGDATGPAEAAGPGS
jgi:NhaA family Na+:H+ antiporter